MHTSVLLENQGQSILTLQWNVHETVREVHAAQNVTDNGTGSDSSHRSSKCSHQKIVMV